LSFRYGGDTVFSDVAFSAGGGEFIAVIGANGSGKSTLMRLMLGELQPHTGTTRLFGEDSRRFRQWGKLGYLAQDGLRSARDFPATAEEIVLANLYGRIGPMRLPGKRHRELARSALADVGVDALAKRMIGSMSGGQRQRVMLARVLVSEPELLFLDEPTTGVDSDTADSLFALLEQYSRSRGLTIIMVTHDTARAARYVSRVLCLEYGSLVELDKSQLSEELSHRHYHPVKRREGMASGDI
jgi:zinc transport system ATP-binding protein